MSQPCNDSSGEVGMSTPTSGGGTLARDAGCLLSHVKKYELVTPLASFSPEDLSRLRHTSPDVYQALLQYEQLCRNSAAVVDAKEAELQRCIDVGEEVLGQIDLLQTRCAQLTKERDDAVANNREQKVRFEGSMADLKKLLGEREERVRELMAKQQNGEVEGHRHEETKVSVMGIPSAAQIVVLHNQLLELIGHVSEILSKSESATPVASSARRMSVASIPAGGDNEEAALFLERWLADSLQQTIQRAKELASAFQLLSRHIELSEDQLDQSVKKHQECEGNISALQHENEHLRQTLVVLQEEVQALDKQTDKMDEFNLDHYKDKLMEKENELEEERHRHSAELLLLHEKHEEERQRVEEEIRSLRAELARCREGATPHATNDKLPGSQESLPLDQQKQRLQGLVSDFDSEKHRHEEEVDQLEAALRDGKASYQRLVTQYEEELQQQQLRAAELARLVAENSRLREQLEQTSASISLVSELTKALETKDIYVAALTRQLHEMEAEIAKSKERGSSSPAPQGSETVSGLIECENLKMEVSNEREKTHRLCAALAACRSQLEELTVLFCEQQRRVKECLQCPLPQPELDRDRVTSHLQVSASRAATRLFNCLEQQHLHLSSLSHSASPVYGNMGAVDAGDSAAVSRSSCSPAAHCSSSPLATVTSGLDKPQEKGWQGQQDHSWKGTSRYLSPERTSPRDNECSIPGYAVFQNSEAAAALSTAMVRFLGDVSEAVVQQLLHPYMRPLEALQRLHTAFSSPSAGPRGGPGVQVGDIRTDTGGCSDAKTENIGQTAEENITFGWLPTRQPYRERLSSDDVVWNTVTDGIVDAFVDACTAVFQRVYRTAGSQLQQCEERLKQMSRQLQNTCEERMRRAALCMAEGEGSLHAQLKVSESKVQTARHALGVLQAKYERETSRCSELTARVNRLEGQLAEKIRELEAGRIQWRNSIRELQDACEAARRQHTEHGARDQHQVQELQDTLRSLRQQLQEARDEGKKLRLEVEAAQAERQRKLQQAEPEHQRTHATGENSDYSMCTLREQLAASNTALQVKLNEEVARVQRANANVESLQTVLRDAQSAYQLMQSTLSDEQSRREVAEERVEGLVKELASLRNNFHLQHQRFVELQEAERLHQCQLDAETRKNEALLKVNRALEGRLAEVEGDREPLRQQLQSLLLLKHC
uniref:Uncharacterized protein n=1 Tax=Trypanosoma congolense (strain IL3000) TaxID=1068625 RepID=G0UVQ2_TRYCI|nr:conserved hypothetical protein [Trypanosoma congolense IL3000]